MKPTSESSMLLLTSLQLLPHSLVAWDGVEYGLFHSGGSERLAVLGSQPPAGFSGESTSFEGKTLLLCPLTPENASALRSVLPWLQPQPLGLRTSAGLGDRLGLATPGHVRAIRRTNGKIAPIFAQQSMREMARIGRTPLQVMDDAMWGVFREGWQDGFGADADHLKTLSDIEVCLAAGFTFFTIDPGEFVDNRAESISLNELMPLADSLPHQLTSESGYYLERSYDLEGLTLRFDQRTLYRAMVKYGKAIQHVAAMYQYLAKMAGARPFELEISIDETEQPTSHLEHIYIASELNRLGVRWVSLAPRFTGHFEKGVDYIGNIADFEADIAVHAAIARTMGPYKLSLHSGSDKFSIYPAVANQTQGLVHLKTAGTSYLEALRTTAMLDASLFREIYDFARSHFAADCQTYHVSADLSRAPQLKSVNDWPGLLDQFDARQILHVTFGSVLTWQDTGGSFTLKNRLLNLLRTHPEVYAQNLENHFNRHFEPFIRNSQEKLV